MRGHFLQSMMYVPNELDAIENTIFFLTSFLAIVAASIFPERRVLVSW
jgi:hypothetical protein